MRWRIGRLALLVFQAVWLNAVLPGHTRGVILLPGAEAACTSGSCCNALDGTSGDHHDQAPVPNNRAAHCAICFFAAHLFLPPVVDLTPPALEVAELRPVLAPACPPASKPFLPYDSRGPPPAASHAIA